MQRTRARAYTPVYRRAAAYARESGELEAWRASHRENIACRDAIDKAIAKHFDGAHLDMQALSTVFDAYGAERVYYVLANSVITKEYDGRFSRDNRAWAQARERCRRANGIWLHPQRRICMPVAPRSTGRIYPNGAAGDGNARDREIRDHPVSLRAIRQAIHTLPCCGKSRRKRALTARRKSILPERRSARAFDG